MAKPFDRFYAAWFPTIVLLVVAHVLGVPSARSAAVLAIASRPASPNLM